MERRFAMPEEDKIDGLDVDWEDTTFGSVIFFKRLIALMLTLVILGLAFLAVHFARAYHQMRRDAEDEHTRQIEEILNRAASRNSGEGQPSEKRKPAGEKNAAEIIAESDLIAHALGAIDGMGRYLANPIDETAEPEDGEPEADDSSLDDRIQGLNCLEGFLQHYEAGIRVYEADFRVTSDGYVVLRHDWRSDLQSGVNATSIPTLEEFLSKPVLGHYTPLSFGDLLLLMERYPDVCIITDTKFTEPEAVTQQFTAMVNEAHELGLSYLFDRFMIQVYSPDEFAVVDAVRHFPYYIYTLYQESFGETEEAFRRKVLFCEENGIYGIAMWFYWWDPSYKAIADWHNIRVFAHTVNDPGQAAALLQSGIDAVYTDSLDPADLKKLEVKR